MFEIEIQECSQFYSAIHTEQSILLYYLANST